MLCDGGLFQRGAAHPQLLTLNKLTSDGIKMRRLQGSRQISQSRRSRPVIRRWAVPVELKTGQHFETMETGSRLAGSSGKMEVILENELIIIS